MLQTDGYAGYSKLRKRKDIVGLGCLTHIRRKFDEVYKISKKNKETIAYAALQRLKPLYALEAQMRERGDDFKTRAHLRRTIACPIFHDFYRWLIKIKSRVPPKSVLGQAITYAFN